MKRMHKNAFALFVATFALWAHAQSYPSHPVRLIVPFPAGGPLDFTARVLSQHLSASLREPFVVENRPGAGGNIGADAVAKSRPDGYTLLVTVDTVLTANPSLYRKIAFDPVRDFRPISTLATFDLALVTHNSVPAASVRELIALAKTLNLAYASGGHGNPGHLLMELLLETAGVRLTHVPYKGNAPAVADLTAGQVQAAFIALPGVLPHVKSGKLRALAVSGTKRSVDLPDVLTISEAGYPDATADFAFMALAPAGTPNEIVHQLQISLATALSDPGIRGQLNKQGIAPLGNTNSDTATRIRSDSNKWTKVIRSLDLQVD